MPSYTMDELRANSMEPILRNLTTRAIRKEKVFYSQLADMLSNSVVPGHVSDQRVGGLVGELAERIWGQFPDAPPINMLVISKTTGAASEGSDNFIKQYFNLVRMPTTRRKIELAEIAVADVWDFDGWPSIYQAMFKRVWLPLDEPRVEQFDDDGQGDNPKFGGLAESEEHKRLKAHIKENPAAIGLPRPSASEIEKLLLSGDEIDVEFAFTSRRVAVEVKSILSGDADFVRGVYQCVKYRAVLQAQYGEDGMAAEAMLVTERTLPDRIAKLAKRLKIKTHVVVVNR